MSAVEVVSGGGSTVPPAAQGRSARPQILYLLTEDFFFCSHFAERAVAAKAAGYGVTIVARERVHGDAIRNLGLKFRPLRFVRGGVNPLGELGTIFAIWKLYREERPDIVHHVGLKPVLYGSLAARLLGLNKIINAPVGMGYAFSNEGSAAQILRPLIRFAMRRLLAPRRTTVVFENIDDAATALADGLVRHGDLVVIRGAGVDVDAIVPSLSDSAPPVVVLVARMLRDKGVVEFVDAARQLRKAGVRARFLLVGAPDDQNPTSLAEGDLRAWVREGVVEWLGHRDDMPAILHQCHIACLPSYREGLPKALLEAMSAGLPIVTTDVVGCREVVADGVNGFLVPARNPAKLAEALGCLIADKDLRANMGARGRERAEREFSSHRIVGETLALYAQTGVLAKYEGNSASTPSLK